MKSKENALAEPTASGARLHELTLLIALRASRLAQQRAMPPGTELALWLEAEAEVKRELHR